tara:strand:+ start:1438 stop:2433 length:996 start_codon:yes stop_codon:yes gene_type:complete
MNFFQFIGTQRSGSNLFRLMLNEFDGVYAPHPPHLLKTFYPILSKYQNLNDDVNLQKLIEDMLKWIHNNPVRWNNVPSYSELFESLNKRSLFEIFRLLYTTNAIKENKNKFWCCKSLFNLKFYNLKEFKSLNPIYIYIYRDGRDVASSFKNASIGDKQIYFLAKQWQSDQMICKKIKDNTSDYNFFSVKYEDLLIYPRKILKRFCEKYDITYNDDFLNYYKSEESKLTSSSGSLWKNLSKPIISNNKGKYKTELSSNEIKIFESLNYESLKLLGYNVDNELSNLIKNFTSEKIEEFVMLNKEIKENLSKKRDNKELELRRRQELILNKSIN